MRNLWIKTFFCVLFAFHVYVYRVKFVFVDVLEHASHRLVGDECRAPIGGKSFLRPLIGRLASVTFSSTSSFPQQQNNRKKYQGAQFVTFCDKNQKLVIF